MAANDVFRLQLHNFDSNISESWKKIQNKKDICDMTLACDDKQILTHKITFSSSIPVF